MAFKPLRKELKDANPFADVALLEQYSIRINKDAALFPNYQINPYTRKTLDFVTPKVNERPPKLPAECIPGYEDIKCALWKAYAATPMEIWWHPQTEGHRHGWWDKRRGSNDPENYDRRFAFSHRTAEFIHVQAMIKAYDTRKAALGATHAPLSTTVRERRPQWWYWNTVPV